MRYKTQAGEHWDEVAYKVLGDCRYTQRLMEVNRDKLEYYVFPAGLELEIPAIEEESAQVPAWR